MEREHLFKHSEEIGGIIYSELQERLKNHPNVGDIRGKGLLLGIELVKDKKSKEPLDVSLVNKVISLCKEKGLIIGKNGVTVAGFNNVLTLSPPLILSLDEKDFIVQNFTQSLYELQELMKN